MALTNLTVLDEFKATPFTPGYPDDARTFFSPVDNVHAALVSLVKSANKSLVLAMFGFDDEELAGALGEKLNHENVYVQFTLDSSQAGGVHERALLAEENYPATSIAVGRSEKGAIMHMKLLIIDGLDVVTGSTNWSEGGESKQDNQLTVVRNAAFAAECRARVDCIHSNMLAKTQKAATP